MENEKPNPMTGDDAIWLNELEQRRIAYRDDPSRGITWEELKSELDDEAMESTGGWGEDR